LITLLFFILADIDKIVIFISVGIEFPSYNFNELLIVSGSEMQMMQMMQKMPAYKTRARTFYPELPSGLYAFFGDPDE